MVRAIIKNICANLNFIVMPYNAKAFSVIAYHRVLSGTNGGITEYLVNRSTQDFEKELAFLIKNFNILSLSEIITLAEKNKLPPHSLAITFDDGYRDNLIYAWEILKKYKVPMTLFVCSDILSIPPKPLRNDIIAFMFTKDFQTDFCIPEFGPVRMDGQNENNRSILLRLTDYLNRVSNAKRVEIVELISNKFNINDDIFFKAGIYLTREDLIKMSREGVEIGAHTASHAILSRLPVLEMEREIGGSKETLEEITGKPVNFFAYPNGRQEDFNQRTIGILKKLGFKAAFSCFGGFNLGVSNSNRYCIKRIPAGNCHEDLKYNFLTSFLK